MTNGSPRSHTELSDTELSDTELSDTELTPASGRKEDADVQRD